MEELSRESLMAGIFVGGGSNKIIETSSSIPENEKFTIQEIPIEKLYPSERNPFSVNEDEAMEELIASIKEKGILMPLVVRPKTTGGYEILSGHRRHFAATKLALETVPAVVMELSDDDSDIIIVDSNLYRLHIPISEKAWAIRMKYDALKRKVGRKKKEEKEGMQTGELSSPTLVGKTADILAAQMGMSDRSIQKNVRLTYLDSELLKEFVDPGILPIKAAVQLSYIPVAAQKAVCEMLQTETIKIDEELAKILREALKEREQVTGEEIYQILMPTHSSETVPVTSAKRSGVKLNKKTRQKYFPEDFDDDKIEQIITELLESWAVQNNPGYEKESAI